MSDCSLLQCILEYSLKHCLIVTWLVPYETAAVLARSVYTVQPCTTSRHFMQSHISRVQASLAVTCHLLAEWLGSFTCYCGNSGVEWILKYKSQHRRLNLEKKILPPHLQGHLTTELSRLPRGAITDHCCFLSSCKNYVATSVCSVGHVRIHVAAAVSPSLQSKTSRSPTLMAPRRPSVLTRSTPWIPHKKR